VLLHQPTTAKGGPGGHERLAFLPHVATVLHGLMIEARWTAGPMPRSSSFFTIDASVYRVGGHGGVAFRRSTRRGRRRPRPARAQRLLLRLAVVVARITGRRLGDGRKVIVVPPAANSQSVAPFDPTPVAPSRRDTVVPEASAICDAGCAARPYGRMTSSWPLAHPPSEVRRS